MPDPLTITATIVALVKTCGTAVTTCSGLIGKYKNAPDILISIRTECIAIKTTLSYVDGLVKRDTELLSSHLKAYSPLAETFDVTLSGCAFTFSLLDSELQKLYDGSKDHNGYKWKDKMRYLWDEDRVKNILDHMRGLQSAVNLMLTALQTTCISALVPLLQDQESVIAIVRQNTVSICESLTTNADRQASSKDYSIFSSIIGDENFSFDDEIVNSLAYRNALKRLASRNKAAQQHAKVHDRHILDEPLIDLEEPSQIHNGPGIKFTAASSHHCLTPAKTSTNTLLLSDIIVQDLKSLLPTSMGSSSHDTNEREADVLYPSCVSESPINASANHRDKNRDVEPAIEQHVKDDVYPEACSFHQLPRKPVRASAEPFRRSGRSTSVTEAAQENFEDSVSLPMKKRSEISCSDITRSSILSEKIETPSALGVERQGARLAVQQVSRGEPHVVFHSSPRTPVTVSGTFDTYHRNVTCVDHGLVLEEAQRNPAIYCHRRRRWVERPIHGGQHDRTSTTKASEDGQIHSSSLVVEDDDTDPERDEKDEISTETFTYNQVNLSQRTREEGNRRRDSDAERFTLTPLTAAALKQHESQYSLRKSDTKSRNLRQRYQKTRATDGSLNSGHRFSLLSNAEPLGDDRVASRSHNNANPGLRESVGSVIRKLIMPDFEALKQEQKMQGSGQKPEPSHLDFKASPVKRTEVSRKLPKHASVPITSDNPKAFPNSDEDNTDIGEFADLTTDISGHTDHMPYLIPNDGSPVTIRIPREEGREVAHTHPSNHSQTSLLIEYFEGRKGPNGHPPPSVRVKLRPSTAHKIKHTNEHVQTTQSKGNRKNPPRRIPLGPHSTSTSKTPPRRRSRGLDKEGLAHKVMEKLAGRPRDVSSSRKHRPAEVETKKLETTIGRADSDTQC